jgi:glyoxylase-like metal-dependent hydrolase (beta-lactamase superfamily II)
LAACAWLAPGAEPALAQELALADFEMAAQGALGGRHEPRVEFTGSGWDACLGQAWSVAEGWARWELTGYRRVTDYDAVASSHATMRRAAMDAGRAGGCGAQPGAAAGPQQGSITAESSWAEQLPLWLTPRGFLKLALAGRPAIAPDGSGWLVTVPVTRGGITYELVGRYNQRFELERIRTAIDDPVFGDLPVVAQFGPYRDFGDLLFPETVTIEQGGHPTFHLAVETARLGTETPEPPAARRPGGAGAAASGPAYERIGDGIFVLLGSYQSVVVELDEFVVVIDGMQSDARVREIIRLTHEVVPGKPIRYAVNTHSHFDHASGLRQLAAEGAVIVTHATNVPFFEAALSTPRTLDDGSTGEPDRVAASVRGVEDRFVIGGESGQAVELHALGPSPHAADMLIAYLPAIKTVVESDLLQPWINPVFGGGRDGPHPYLTYLHEELERLGLDYEQFVPIHVPPDPPTMPRAALIEAVAD